MSTSRQSSLPVGIAPSDREQILEMLRLTPTQRLRKAWLYGRLALELQHAGRFRTHHPLVMDLDDVIKSKRAAGRPKDRAVLPVLEETSRLRHSDDLRSEG